MVMVEVGLEVVVVVVVEVKVASLDCVSSFLHEPCRMEEKRDTHTRTQSMCVL